MVRVRVRPASRHGSTVADDGTQNARPDSTCAGDDCCAAVFARRNNCCALLRTLSTAYPDQESTTCLNS